MVTSFELPFDLTEETIATILLRKNNPKSGEQLKVYIPRIMRGIEKGKPTKRICSHGHITLANSGGAPALSGALMEQNYLIGLYQNNSTSRSIVEVVYNEDDDMEKAYIPAEKDVRCCFANGKLKQLRLNTNNNMSYNSNEYIYEQYVLKPNHGEDGEEEDDEIEEVDYSDETSDDDEYYEKDGDIVKKKTTNKKSLYSK